MTTKTNSYQESSLARMASVALMGDKNAALTMLNQSGLNEAQKQKIAAILNASLPDNTLEGAQAMNQRICAVIGEEDILLNGTSEAPANEQFSPSQVTQGLHSEQQCVSFTDTSKSPFANIYPCDFEFGGHHYQSATACFLAQQYTDQPNVMTRFTTLNPEEASSLAQRTAMTKERKCSWENPSAEHINKDSQLMHVLRAKFGQNSELRKKLLATGSAYLVCQGQDFYLSDNFNGKGKNALGISLMQLRGEYGGTGLVEPNASYSSTTEHLGRGNDNAIFSEIPHDVLRLLFLSCISECELNTIKALPCINRAWNQFAKSFWEDCYLTELCPELTILDAKAQEENCDDEPEINNFKIFHSVKQLSPRVINNAGLTLLTVRKGTTPNQLIEIAKKEGLIVNFVSPQIIRDLGNVPIEQTYRTLITNDILKNTQFQNLERQKAILDECGSEMPKIQDYLALWVFKNKILKKSSNKEKIIWTRGRTSSQIGTQSIHVWCSNAAGNTFLANMSVPDNGTHGAAGQRKFDNKLSPSKKKLILKRHKYDS